MRLATPTESKIEIQKHGATFYGRVIPQAEIKAIRARVKKAPEKDGEPLDVDPEEFLFAMFDAAVTGWADVADFEGNEIEFKKGLVREIEEMNPGFANDVLMAIHSKAAAIRRREDEATEAERKNS